MPDTPADPPPPSPVVATLYCRKCGHDLLPVFVEGGETFITGKETPDGPKIIYSKIMCGACGTVRTFRSLTLVDNRATITPDEYYQG